MEDKLQRKEDTYGKMINIKQIRHISKSLNKKIGKKALKKLNSIIEEFVKDKIKSASRKADISGRTIIKEHDLSD